MDLWTLIEAGGLRIGTIRRCEWELVDAQGMNINAAHRCSRLAYCIEGAFKPIISGLEHERFLRALRGANSGKYLNAGGAVSDGPVSRVRVAPPGWTGAPLRITELEISGDYCRLRLDPMECAFNERAFFLTRAERDAIRALIAFVRAGCPDGPSPPGFPIGRNEDFRRAALEYFSDPPDPANHFRIDVPSDEYVARHAAVRGPSSVVLIELDLFADGERCDLTATFDLDRRSTVDSGPRLYDMHVM
ncbi:MULTISPECIES: hypothetical protein [Stenotrophomonas]|uniref:hypothetical protein n=1 Tax=Stenotrophomonas pavanii TaxID=487698 RepID=UPI0012B0002C|nr:hypothetical protein FEO90_20170 [Stenotrophomonas maltophilia]